MPITATRASCRRLGENLLLGGGGREGFLEQMVPGHSLEKGRSLACGKGGGEFLKEMWDPREPDLFLRSIYYPGIRRASTSMLLTSCQPYKAGHCYSHFLCKERLRQTGAKKLAGGNTSGVRQTQLWSQPVSV